MAKSAVPLQQIDPKMCITSHDHFYDEIKEWSEYFRNKMKTEYYKLLETNLQLKLRTLSSKPNLKCNDHFDDTVPVANASYNRTSCLE
jgi:hypothetical protein